MCSSTSEGWLGAGVYDSNFPLSFSCGETCFQAPASAAFALFDPERPSFPALGCAQTFQPRLSHITKLLSSPGDRWLIRGVFGLPNCMS